MNRKQAENKIDGYEQTELEIMKERGNAQDRINDMSQRLDNLMDNANYNRHIARSLSDGIGLLMQRQGRLDITISEMRSRIEHIKADVIEGFIK